MANYKEISNALKILLSNGLKKEKITILQCTSDYPTKFKDVNLRVMNEYKKNLKQKLDYLIILMVLKLPLPLLL